MMFATHQDYRGTTTQFEFAVSQAMEVHLLAYMKDPVNGPPSLRWRSYVEVGMPKFGADGKVGQSLRIGVVCGACYDTDRMIQRHEMEYEFPRLPGKLTKNAPIVCNSER